VDRPVMLSANSLRDRVSDIEVGEWMLDSGAYSQIDTHGEFQSSPAEYAAAIERWADCGTLKAAVSQDYMCEPHIRAKTGGSVEGHQRWTVRRRIQLRHLWRDRLHQWRIQQSTGPMGQVRQGV